MLNSLLLNTATLNSGTPVPSALAAADYEDIEFDGYGLQNTTIISQLILRDSPPHRDVVSFRTPRRDGGGILTANFAGRSVRVRGILKASTASELDTLLDTFKKRVSKQERDLDIKVNGAIRSCVATMVNPETMFSRRESYHITDCPFDLEFLSMDPFWKSPEYTSDADLSQTSLSFSKDVGNDGSWKADVVAVFIVDAATAATVLSLTNNTNGDAITITETISAGDVLIIDGEAKSVTLNGTEVDYTGVFPQLDTGDNNLTLAVTASSMTWNMTLKHKKTYL